MAAERVALAGAGAPLDDLQSARGHRMVVGGALVRAQRGASGGGPCDSRRHARPALADNSRGQRQRRPLLLAHRAGGVPLAYRPAFAVMQGEHLPMPQDRRLDAVTLFERLDVLGEIPVQIPLAERRVVAGQRRQHLQRVPRRGMVGSVRIRRPLVELTVAPPHAHRAEMLGRMRDRRIDAHLIPVRPKERVLMLTPRLPKTMRPHDEGLAAIAPDLGVEVARLVRCQPVALEAPGGDQHVGVPVRGLGFEVARMRRMDVDLRRQSLGNEVLVDKSAGQLEPVRLGDLRIGRQRQDHLQHDLAVAAVLGGLHRVPQRRRVPEHRVRPHGQ